MKISFLGAARSTTGSKHLITVNGKNILLDCGLYQGRRDEAFEKNKNLPFNPQDIDSLVLSHAHIDHSGNIPRLVANGFNGSIFCTSATRDLCSIMLADSAHIQEHDAKYVNKLHAQKGLPAVEPLYTSEDVSKCMEQFVSVGYNRPFAVTSAVSGRFFDAGHILGSAVVLLEIREDGREIRLAFSGDLGRPDMAVLRDPVQVHAVDVLIIESTYGNRVHDDLATVTGKLASAVNRTYERGGKIIIPAFSVGRTQEITYYLNTLLHEGKIPELPIFVDSPLSTNATEVFRMHPECFDMETRRFLQRHDDPFGYGRFKYIRDVEESKKLNTYKEPCIIISASGMCEAGRILHHLKNNIGNAYNTILIVGFMAQNTLGRRLVERHDTVKIFGEPYELRAEVVVLNAFSAHADRNELLKYVSGINTTRIKKVFVVHGEEDQSLSFADALTRIVPGDIEVPELGEEVEI